MRPFYWRTSHIPELKHLTKADRTEVWAASAGALFREPVTYLVGLGCVIGFGLGYFVGTNLLTCYAGIILGAILGNVIGQTMFWYYAAEKIRPHLAKTIKNRKLD